MINQMREEIIFTCSLTSKCFLSMLKEKKEIKNICLHRNKFIRMKIASRTDLLSLFFGGIVKLFIEFLRSNSLNRKLFFVFVSFPVERYSLMFSFFWKVIPKNLIWKLKIVDRSRSPLATEKISSRKIFSDNRRYSSKIGKENLSRWFASVQCRDNDERLLSIDIRQFFFFNEAEKDFSSLIDFATLGQKIGNCLTKTFVLSTRKTSYTSLCKFVNFREENSFGHSRGSCRRIIERKSFDLNERIEMFLFISEFVQICFFRSDECRLKREDFSWVFASLFNIKRETIREKIIRLTSNVAETVPISSMKSVRLQRCQWQIEAKIDNAELSSNEMTLDDDIRAPILSSTISIDGVSEQNLIRWVFLCRSDIDGQLTSSLLLVVVPTNDFFLFEMKESMWVYTQILRLTIQRWRKTFR